MVEERLRSRLRQAEEGELLRLLEKHEEELDPAAALLVLRNPYAGREVVQRLVRNARLRRYYEVRRALAGHRGTPEARALSFVAGLYWRDLLAVGRDVRSRPSVRRATERTLASRLPGLTEGERIAIARQAGPTLIGALRRDGSARVVAALLENPRLTEGLLAPLAADPAARPRVLRQVAASRRWSSRTGIRLALCRNPAAPEDVVLPLLPTLPKGELREIAGEARLATAVRRRAALLIGELRS